VETTSPLECDDGGRFFSRVPSSRLAVGLRTGLILGAATAGVIVGLGVRYDSALTPFLLAGRATIATMSGLVVSPLVATVSGIVVHTAWMLLWGVCFSAVATALRGVRLWVAAAIFAALVGVLSATIVPGALGAGAMVAQTGPQTVVFLTLFAVALLAGMRFARS